MELLKRRRPPAVAQSLHYSSGAKGSRAIEPCCFYASPAHTRTAAAQHTQQMLTENLFRGYTLL